MEARLPWARRSRSPPFALLLIDCTSELLGIKSSNGKGPRIGGSMESGSRARQEQGKPWVLDWLVMPAGTLQAFEGAVWCACCLLEKSSATSRCAIIERSASPLPAGATVNCRKTAGAIARAAVREDVLTGEERAEEECDEEGERSKAKTGRKQINEAVREKAP
eukprot:6185174-Pleurochrysis_carterae.AAC.1